MTANRTVRLVLSLLAGLLLAGTVTTTAHAEDGYRFWSYYQWTSGQWVFSQKGADVVVPADGAIEGWRYGVSGTTKLRIPRAAGDFTAICGATPAESGKKRVALVIDPGTAADSASGVAPPPATGTCVVTDVKASGAKILAAVEKVRIEKGLTCAIAGFPATGCGDQVKNMNVPATEEPVKLEIGAAVGAASIPTAAADDGGTPWTGIIIAALVVVVLAGAGLTLSRRRSAGQ